MTIPIVRKTPGRAAALLARLRARAGDPYAAASADRLEDALRAADRCRVCGRHLENETSRRLGIGPECRGNDAASKERRR